MQSELPDVIIKRMRETRSKPDLFKNLIFVILMLLMVGAGLLYTQHNQIRRDVHQIETSMVEQLKVVAKAYNQGVSDDRAAADNALLMFCQMEELRKTEECFVARNKKCSKEDGTQVDTVLCQQHEIAE